MNLLDRTFDHSTVPVSGAKLDAQAIRGVEQFLFNEARLLDERRFDEWLGLWRPEGRYWVPRHHGQQSPFDQISMFWEDAVLRELRVRRITNPRNWSQQPVTRSSRLVGQVQIDGLDAEGRLIVSSSMQLTEYRLDQRQLAARVFHKLESDDDGRWRLHLKRVNLVNLDAIFSNLEVFL